MTFDFRSAIIYIHDVRVLFIKYLKSLQMIFVCRLFYFSRPKYFLHSLYRIGRSLPFKRRFFRENV